MTPNLPRSLLVFIWQVSSWHQLPLSILSVAVFLLNTAPLELQRRIINDAFRGGNYQPILLLTLAYAGLSLFAGLVKLSMNVYRSWISERTIMSLRDSILALTDVAEEGDVAQREGVEVSMVVAESEPIGGFVGSSISEPLLQGGMLVSVFGYMIFLQPIMALLTFLLFAPQLLFVPVIQKAINRRVVQRVSTLRDISAAIIGGSHTLDRLQEQRVQRAFTLGMGIYKLTFTMKFLINLCHHFGIATILGLGGWYVSMGNIELGTVVAFISGLAAINDPWADLVNWFRDLAMTRAKYQLIITGIEQIIKKPAPRLLQGAPC
jgi:ABC-type multidrug transport system fused ATPase/permease subunit